MEPLAEPLTVYLPKYFRQRLNIGIGDIIDFALHMTPVPVATVIQVELRPFRIGGMIPESIFRTTPQALAILRDVLTELPLTRSLDLRRGLGLRLPFDRNFSGERIRALLQVMYLEGDGGGTCFKMGPETDFVIVTRPDNDLLRRFDDCRQPMSPDSVRKFTSVPARTVLGNVARIVQSQKPSRAFEGVSILLPRKDPPTILGYLRRPNATEHYIDLLARDEEDLRQMSRNYMLLRSDVHPHRVAPVPPREVNISKSRACFQFALAWRFQWGLTKDLVTLIWHQVDRIEYFDWMYGEKLFIASE